MTEPSDRPVPAQRRQQGGARVEVSERVTLRAPGFETTGWTLNVSRGGVRAVVEDEVPEVAECELVLGDDASGRRVRVVWRKQAKDGEILGLQYLDVLTSDLPPPPEGSDLPPPPEAD
ncbi:MAG: PilZ domain-containing protein [Pseudomonadota bacterium]